MKKIALVGTFDTKGEEYLYMSDCIKKLGCDTLFIDVSTRETAIPVDISSSQVAARADITKQDLLKSTRSEALTLMAKGAASCLKDLHQKGEIDGVFAMGGSGGTTVGTDAMRNLPVGFPKFMLTTLAGSPNLGRYIGGTDIITMGAVVDVAGLNTLTKTVFNQAAAAIVGAVMSDLQIEGGDKKRIAATMYGVVSKGVLEAKRLLESKGYEVIIFHAVGSGGAAMESLIEKGFFHGLLDAALPEVHSHVLGSAMGSAGGTRLSAAGKVGIPTVVVLGAMDMYSTNKFDDIGDRKIYCHNDKPSHLRPNGEDMAKSGLFIAEKLSCYKGEVALFIPTGGMSMMSVEGGILEDRAADNVLFETVKKNLPQDFDVVVVETDINNASFAEAVATKLSGMMKKKYEGEDA